MSYQETEESVHSGAPVELYRFTKGASVYRYTSADHDVTVDLGDGDETFSSEKSISRSDPEQSKETKATELTVTVPRNLDVAALFKAFVPVVKVGLTIFRLHETDEDEEIVAFWKGTVESVEWEESEAALTCAPITASFKKNGLHRLHQAACNHALYGERCGVNKENWKRTATVTGIDGDEITALAFAAEEDGWFETGWVEDTDGVQVMIYEHTGTALKVLQMLPGLEVGDTVYAFAGCKRRFQEDCIDKFGDDGGGRPGNGANHGGFPTVPKKNPFETGVE